MTTAEQKYQENIAEYVLFLWQMEDLARAVQFNTDVVRSMYQGSDEETLEREVQWFGELCTKMKSAGVEEKGHIPEIQEILNELTVLHNNLLNIIKDKNYLELRSDAFPVLKEFLEKTKGAVGSEVEAYLTALYGWLLLRMKGTDVGEGTEDAMKKFSQIMAYLAGAYFKMKSGESNSGLN